MPDALDQAAAALLPPLTEDLLSRASPPSPAGGNAAASKATLIDKWVLRRIQEANIASLRVEKRIETLKQAEAQLLRSVHALRTGMTAAQPVATKLESVINSAQKQVDMVLAAATARVKALFTETETQAAQAVTPLQDQVTELLGRARAEIRKSIETLPLEVEPMARQLQQHLSDQVQRAQEALAASLAEHQQAADAVGVRVRTNVDAALEKTLESVNSFLTPVGHEFERRMEARSAETRAAVDRSVEEARLSLEARTQAVLTEIDARQARLREAAGTEASHAAVEIRADLDEAARQLSVKLQRDMEDRSRKLMADVEEMFERRLSELKPRLLEETDALHQSLTQRTQAIIAGARAVMDVHEDQLAARVTHLKHQAASAVRDATGMLDTSLSKMSEDAATRSRRIEAQLNTRVDDLLRTSQRLAG